LGNALERGRAGWAAGRGGIRRRWATGEGRARLPTTSRPGDAAPPEKENMAREGRAFSGAGRRGPRTSARPRPFPHRGVGPSIRTDATRSLGTALGLVAGPALLALRADDLQPAARPGRRGPWAVFRHHPRACWPPFEATTREERGALEPAGAAILDRPIRRTVRACGAQDRVRNAAGPRGGRPERYETALGARSCRSRRGPALGAGERGAIHTRRRGAAAGGGSWGRAAATTTRQRSAACRRRGGDDCLPRHRFGESGGGGASSRTAVEGAGRFSEVHRGRWGDLGLRLRADLLRHAAGDWCAPATPLRGPRGALEQLREEGRAPRPADPAPPAELYAERGARTRRWLGPCLWERWPRLVGDAGRPRLDRAPGAIDEG